MEIEYRSCKYDDLDFIVKLKELCIKWYIEIIHGWDIEVQKRKTKEELDHHIDGIRIMLDNDKPMGLTTFYEENGEYFVGLIIVHPDYQGIGIGNKIISEYIEKAKEDKKRINIKAYKKNRARNLYKKLGFKKYKEDETHEYLCIEFNKERRNKNGK